MTTLSQAALDLTGIAAAGALPLLIVLTPLAAAAAVFCLRDDQTVARAAASLAGPSITLVLVAAMTLGVLDGRRHEARIPFLPGEDVVLRSDALAVLFAGLSAVLWLVTTVYALAYMRKGPNRSRFFGCFALCVSAAMGAALAGNLITFVVFFEALTLATYPLVVHYGDEKTLRAGRVYLIYTLSGGAALLLGALLLHALHGSSDFVVGGHLAQAATRPGDLALQLVFAALIAGVGVKAAIAPLHGWLPTAMVAPAPVSALLHAVAVVKVGAFGVVRIVHDVFGVALAQDLGVLPWLAGLAAFTILYGSVRALWQEDLKRRLAYSTVSQVSYITLGAALAHPAAAVGAIMHLIHQGVMKITLFYCAGAFAEATGVKTVGAMDGMGRRMPLTSAAFTIGALGMIGAPPTAGFATKWWLAEGGLAAGQPWVVAVLLASSALNAGYFLPVLGRMWFRESPGPLGPDAPEPWRLALMAAAPMLTAGLTLAAALLATSVFSPLGWAQALALDEFGFGR